MCIGVKAIIFLVSPFTDDAGDELIFLFHCTTLFWYRWQTI